MEHMRGQNTKTPENLARAHELRDQGCIYKDIATEIGVSLSTVAAWFADPDGSKTKERKRRYEGVCEDCGGRVSGQAGVTGRARYCGSCGPSRGGSVAGAMQHARAEPRYQRFVRRWNEGASYPVLMAEFGISKGRVSSLLHRLRKQGYDLPYRYAVENGRRVAASV